MTHNKKLMQWWLIRPLINLATLTYLYLGWGEPLMGFCPYFLHEYSSAGISAVLALIAGTLITLFNFNFLHHHFNLTLA